jgi:hypothetical protein
MMTITRNPVLFSDSVGLRLPQRMFPAFSAFAVNAAPRTT